MVYSFPIAPKAIAQPSCVPNRKTVVQASHMREFPSSHYITRLTATSYQFALGWFINKKAQSLPGNRTQDLSL
ncbi:MAG TPA: hypothetical protein V6C91_00020 [Coleofasciculaceae cyanobacterium]